MSCSYSVLLKRGSLAAAVWAVLVAFSLLACSCHAAASSPANIVLNGGSTTLLSGMNATVNVQYTFGSSVPVVGGSSTLTYFLGLFSPPVPVPFTGKQSPYMQYAIDVPTAGNFTVPVWLLNMRAAHSVALMSLDSSTNLYATLAVSNSVGFTNYKNPQHVHLVLQGAGRDAASQMGVQWTAQATARPSVVRWGLSPTDLTLGSATATGTTFAATQLCGNPGYHKGWRDPATQYQAIMTNLQPNTQYFYQVGDPVASGGLAVSDVLSFYSAPEVSPFTDTDFYIFGDMGVQGSGGWIFEDPADGSTNSSIALALDVAQSGIGQNRSGAVFHIGDIAYAHGYEATWNAFFWQIQPFSQRMPWMTSEGNHERSYPGSGSLYDENTSGGECGVPYNNRFQMPLSAPSGGGPKNLDSNWYSVVYGPLTHILAASEHNFSRGTDQYDFLEKAFKAVDRTVTPWLIFSMHRPLYQILTPAQAARRMAQVFAPGSLAAMTADLLQLLELYDVDVAFWAHAHSYERTCYARDWQCIGSGAATRNATMHVLTGAAGAPLSSPTVSITRTASATTIQGIYGYSRVQLRNNTMTLQFVSSTPDRAVLDEITLQSKYPQRQAPASNNAQPTASSSTARPSSSSSSSTAPSSSTRSTNIVSSSTGAARASSSSSSSGSSSSTGPSSSATPTSIISSSSGAVRVTSSSGGGSSIKASSTGSSSGTTSSSGTSSSSSSSSNSLTSSSIVSSSTGVAQVTSSSSSSGTTSSSGSGSSDISSSSTSSGSIISSSSSGGSVASSSGSVQPGGDGADASSSNSISSSSSGIGTAGAAGNSTETNAAADQGDSGDSSNSRSSSVSAFGHSLTHGWGIAVLAGIIAAGMVLLVGVGVVIWRCAKASSARMAARTYSQSHLRLNPLWEGASDSDHLA